MRNRRLLATTTLLAAALTLSLSACGPDETTAAGPAKSTGPSATANPSATTPASTPATAPATSAPVTAPPAPTQTPTPKTTPIGLPSSQPTSQPTPHPTTKPTTAKPTAAAPTPGSDCTAAANHPGHKVINATVAWGDPNRIGANATTFVCGPDVPNDGYYQAVAPNTGYTFAPGAKATLLGRYVSTDPSTAVSITDLLTHINQCVQHPGADGPHLCYGNNYDITVNGAGQITTITELYHP
ncbi:hypothetical protein OG500_22135 [Kitasatospora sp. NBC_01250]|uniref:hypothetical protein n=1 Tax=Kitasatospora sp. NBC_01250 TaxID=2903571 RepID=UPI002E370EBF|nr:hypothetical protein [Kitasatospora sp. NBC_01250]